jgi:hypothetical protein
MRYIYLVWEFHGFMEPCHLIAAYSIKEAAEENLKRLQDALPPEDVPEYDDYGLVDGIEYRIEKMEIDV